MSEATVVGPGRTLCDDCGGEASIVVSDMDARTLDVLCWPCMIKRAMYAGMSVAEQAASET